MNWRNFKFQQSESLITDRPGADPASSPPDPIRGRAQLFSMILYGQSRQYLHATLTRSGSTAQAGSSAVYVNSKVTGVIKKKYLNHRKVINLRLVQGEPCH